MIFKILSIVLAVVGVLLLSSGMEVTDNVMTIAGVLITLLGALGIVVLK